MSKVKSFKVIHQDRFILAVHKPAGIVVYRDDPKDKTPSLLDLVKKRYWDEQSKVYPVHRLDRGTCGIVLFARDPKTASLLQKMFKESKIQKKYWAVCFGLVPPQMDIKKSLPANKTKEMQFAHTKIKRLGIADVEENKLSWIEAELKTGRYHQIRRHCRGEGFPLVGDEDYAGEIKADWSWEVLQIKRPALCAIEARFMHPMTRKDIVIKTSPDRDLELLIENYFKKKKVP